MASKKKIQLQPWGLDISAMFTGNLSGNRAADIHKLIANPIVQDALLKASIKKLQAIMDEVDSLPEEIEVAAKEVEKYQGISTGYKAPLNVIWRDDQVMGSDNKPIPIIAQHFILAAFRDTAADSFHKEFMLATQTERKGRVGRPHLRKYVQVLPHHIFLFKDPELEHLVESKDIIIEGQQPVGQAVRGFAQYEVLQGPLYFNFKMIFHPEGKFPALADQDLVAKTLYQATFRGLGGRRAANYGQWKILQAKKISFDKPFILVGGGESNAGNTTLEPEAESPVRKAS